MLVLATYIRDNHVRIQSLVLAEKPLGTDKNYAELNEHDQDLFDEFFSSCLITEAVRDLPFKKGPIIAALLNILICDPLGENPHMEAYRHLEISDDQIITAKALIQSNFEIIQQRRQESPVSRGAFREHLRQALGSEIVSLLEENMEITTEEAFEIFTHLQQRERLDHNQWNREERTDDESEEEFSLDLLNTYGDSPAYRRQRHWGRYAKVGIAALGIGALVAFLSHQDD